MTKSDEAYEFSTAHNVLFLDFAAKLRTTATAAWVCAVAALASVVPLVLESRFVWCIVPVALAAYLGWVGARTRHAAGDLDQVVSTSGADIEHLMHAMTDLHALYRLKMYLVLIFMAVRGLGQAAWYPRLLARLA